MKNAIILAHFALPKETMASREPREETRDSSRGSHARE
jgi:hypothetical protein